MYLALTADTELNTQSINLIGGLSGVSGHLPVFVAVVQLLEVVNGRVSNYQQQPGSESDAYPDGFRSRWDSGVHDGVQTFF